ncbi:MAG: HAD family hydrolase [Pseudomonadota bacterium]
MAYTNTLTVDEAFNRYEAIRPRLPAATTGRTTQDCNGLLDIADGFDAFLLDGFGVLNVGKTAIPGAVACIKALRERGKRLIVLTNAASYPPAAAQARYRAMGFDFSADEILSSRTVCAARLNAIEPDIRWGAIAAPEDRFEDVNASVVHWMQNGVDDVGGFLFLSSASLSATLLGALQDALKAKTRPMAVANPDLVAPRETGLSIEPGYCAHQLADATGITPSFFGKPFNNAFKDALALLDGLEPSRVAMVGDTLHTDILGGSAAGCATVLVRDHGLFAGRSVDPYVARSGIVPDFACPAI